MIKFTRFVDVTSATAPGSGGGGAAGGGDGGAVVPFKPKAPVLTAMSAAISVAFEVPYDGGSEITQGRFLDDQGIVTPLTGDNPQIIAKPIDVLIKGKIAFMNDIGWGDYSDFSNSVTPTNPIVVPGKPAKPILTPGTNQVTVAYTLPSDGGSPILQTQYTDINSVTTDLTGSPQVVPATGGVPTTGTVRCRNIIGWGPYSDQADAVTPLLPPVLFDTVTAYPAGQRVIYAGGLYSFDVAHAAGNWTGNDATYISQSGTYPLNTIGFSKPFGITDNWTQGTIQTSSISTPATSRGLKQSLEAPFTAVRIVRFQREPSPQRGLAFSAAATEVAAVDTLANAINPIVNGVTYNVDRATSQYGFLRGNWASADRQGVQPPGGVSPIGQNYVTDLSNDYSEWVAVQSVPAVGGGRPLLVMRLNTIYNTYDASSNIRVAVMTSKYNTYVANQNAERLYYNPIVGNGDHVANPTLSQSAGVRYDPTTNGNWQNMGIFAQHAVPTRNLAGFGDSITEGYQWWQNVTLALSTQKAPVYYANFGCSTNKTPQYMDVLRSQVRQDNSITDVIIPCFGYNSSTTEVTDAFADAAILELQAIISLLVARKIRVYIWTHYAAKTSKFAGFPVCVAAITKLNNWTRNNTSLGYSLVEIEAGWDNATMIAGDGVHPGALGIPYMSGQLNPVFQKGIA